MFKDKMVFMLLALLFVACIPSANYQNKDSITLAASPLASAAYITIAPSPSSTSISKEITTSPGTATNAPAITTMEYMPLVLTETSSPPPPSSDAMIADHTVVDLFDLIPDGPVQAASNLRVLQMHQSVGNRITRQGLECLQGTNASAICNKYPDYKYDRRNWTWEYWEVRTSDASNKLAQFVDEVNSRNANFDVFGMKFCFLDTRNQSFEAYRDAMLQLESTYPDKTILWSTQAIRPLWPDNVAGGCEIIQNFNKQVRAYALANGKPLFDIASIESHDANGNACYTGCEAMCGEWGADGLDYNGHLNFNGAVRIAKAYWWLMARVAGWDGQAK